MEDNEYKKKKIRKLLLLLVLVLAISVGFALLSTTLFINGTSTIKGNTWDIRWDSDSVAVTEGSVAAQDPTVTENDTKVSFEVELELPGDYYEFTIDAINAGTIDGMISDIVTTVKDGTGETATLPEYIHFSVTYADGVPIAKNHLLPKRVDAQTPTREKYKVRLEYDEEETTVPANDITYTVTYDVTYDQANENGIEREVIQHDTDADTIFTYNASTGTLTGFKPNLDPQPTNIVIPNTIDNVTITTLGSAAFAAKNLTSVKIPSTVTTIGYTALGHNNISKVVVPSSVTTIQDAGLINNNMTSVTLNEGLQTIGGGVFSLNNLKTVTIPSTVTNIGTGAFLVEEADQNNAKNSRLIKIVNKTNRAFDWDNIINSSNEGRYTFKTGTVTTNIGTTVEIVSE